jgi:heme-degrading monooxygenase HmoA
MIRVFIERLIAETMETTYDDVEKQTLQAAVCAPGFISGESLTDIKNPRHRVVLCKFRSELDWNNWASSPERKEMMAKINLILEGEEKITLLDMA